MITYISPDNWIKYDPIEIGPVLVEAKASVLALRGIPYQKDWVESLQDMELKREVAGTSKIEGADFSERELEDAFHEKLEDLLTRSQRQARAAVDTYRWISTVPDDRPVDGELIREIHRRIVTNADDDHCEPGMLRKQDQNVTFGQPRHRGVSGGPECSEAYNKFVDALQDGFRNHDPLIQALAAHYHLAAMHPFLDGNGRTARALGSLLKQRAGLRDACFISMSNYYYDEKRSYLAALAEARSRGHDLTPFLVFGLRGVTIQATRVLNSIQNEVAKAIFRNMMFDLFTKLETPKKRVIAERQLTLLKLLLEHEKLTVIGLVGMTATSYSSLQTPIKAFFRDLNSLIGLGAVLNDSPGSIKINLDWPREITESVFFERLKKLPKAKTSH
jgi:Fic family protein